MVQLPQNFVFASLLLSCASFSRAATLRPRNTTPELQWGKCPSDAIPAAVKCATISVPLDYSNPQGAEITLLMARLQSNSTTPKGSIFVNPGGPGGSATELIAKLAMVADETLPGQLLRDYHVVGVDPRGVGGSNPIKCSSDLWNKQIPVMPRDESEFDTMVKHWKAVGESCANMTGPLINNLDTISVVRDLDRVREALCEEKLNWIGLSYGTQIGLSYSELFPHNVGRMVLDGMVDHSQQMAYLLGTESTTYETTLHKFFDWCANSTDCALHSQTDVQNFFTSLIATADRSPIPAPDCAQSGEGACQPSVTAEKLINAVQLKLITVTNAGYGDDWASLSEELLAASQGNATALSPAFYVGETDSSGGDWIELAVGCQDFPHAKDYNDLKALLHMSGSLSPITRGYTQSLRSIARCIGWPAPMTNPPRAFQSSIREAPKMLLVNSFWDPETSVQWAVSVREQLQDNTNLVFRNGSGHTSYLLGGETAMAINEFLLEGDMPVDGTIYQS